MSLKAVIFDFGGVLVRTHSQDLRRRWEERLGLQPGQAESIVFGGETDWSVQLGVTTNEAHWQWLGRRFGLEDDTLEELRRDFFADDALDVGLLAYIDRLRLAGYHTGILSNAGDNARDFFAHTYSVTGHFDSITISAEEGIMKPDTRIFEIALRRAGSKPTEAVFVDDLLANVEAARRLGMRGVHFTSPDAAYAELVELTGVE
jgi:epoxide hydrolase-like predicted phosphatase